MNPGGYQITQLQAPTTEQFYAALHEAGLDWPRADILERHRHPGMQYAEGDTISLILQPVHFDREADTIELVQAAAVLGPQHGVIARWDGDCLDEAFERPHQTRDGFICALVEQVYDSDTFAMESLEERVDDCELEVLDADGQGTTAQLIYHLEHELMTVRRSVGPMVGLLDRLSRKADEGARAHIAEWRDRFVRLVGQMEDLDGLLTSVLSVNLTLVSVRQNEDNRKIAAWGAIGIAPTAMAGIWGMNFEHMPELNWVVGYPLALGSIALVCILLYRNFKQKGWL
ncbi:MAG TPA: CorA family divalent cation transporter [Acidimicrobiales bacterium]|nr:CorA family divalent cation transporter [Acidimicrobiales bacterium]